MKIEVFTTSNGDVRFAVLLSDDTFITKILTINEFKEFDISLNPVREYLNLPTIEENNGNN